MVAPLRVDLICCSVILSLIYFCLLPGCNDISKAPPPDPGPGALTIVTTSLPNGTVNQPYATALGGTGGITPYTWSLAAGSPPLPAGLSLDNTTGAITGTPTATGTTNLVFQLDDSSSPEQVVQKSLSLTITVTPQPLAITTSSLPEGTVNQPYPPTTLAATGGTQPYKWTVSPPLPNGLLFNVPSAGTISGTPSIGTAGTTIHTFMVVDSAISPQSDSRQLSLKINAAPLPLEIVSPTGNLLPNAREGRKYNQKVEGSGGTPPYTWSVNPDLPAGLNLDTRTGAITGTPFLGTAGTYSLTFTLQDSAQPNNQTSRIYSLQVRKF